MRRKIHVRKGDKVKVIAGEHKGEEGKVLFVIADNNKAVVEGMNMVSKHTKPQSTDPQSGGIVKKEAPIHLSNLMVVDSKGDATRIGRKVEDGKIVRYSKKSGEVIK